jgi:hypothetical protein
MDVQYSRRKTATANWYFFEEPSPVEMRVRKPATHPMPEMAAFVASLQAAFGEQEIDAAIRKGKAGEPRFYASGNGRSVGTASPASTFEWKVDGTLRDRHFCPGCDGSCVGTEARCRRH